MDSMELIYETIKDVFGQNDQESQVAEQFFKLFKNKIDNNISEGDLIRMVERIKLRGEIDYGN